MSMRLAPLLTKDTTVQMDNFSRRYYERELGAGIAPSPSMREHFGYTEPFRRFVQRENFSPQANPLRNEMPSWLPRADYLTNFHIGDPYTKVDEGYARLPGAGYEALHPELKGLTPTTYPDINKLAILADVAPYSREYNIFRRRSATTHKTTPNYASSTRRSSTASGRQGSPSSGWITRSFRPAGPKTPHAFWQLGLAHFGGLFWPTPRDVDVGGIGFCWSVARRA